MTHMEKEFKNLLTAAQYAQLKDDYASIWTRDLRQTNSYFDNDGLLEAAHMALRIRLIDEADTGEVTLKMPQSTLEVIEITVELPRTQLEWWIEMETFVLPTTIQTALQEQGIQIDNVHATATLHTHRLEGALDANSLLVLDESRYYDQTDYEIEMEVQDIAQGEATFQELMHRYHIERSQSPSKIVRATKAKRKADAS